MHTRILTHTTDTHTRSRTTHARMHARITHETRAHNTRPSHALTFLQRLRTQTYEHSESSVPVSEHSSVRTTQFTSAFRVHAQHVQPERARTDAPYIGATVETEEAVRRYYRAMAKLGVGLMHMVRTRVHTHYTHIHTHTHIPTLPHTFAHRTQHNTVVGTSPRWQLNVV